MKTILCLLLTALLGMPCAFAESQPPVAGTGEVAFTIPVPSWSMPTPQGGCSDGAYYYQAFIRKDKSSNEENNIARIVKVDLQTGEKVLVSEDLALNHCNDLTYNPRLDRLIVCHNNPHRTRISFLDPATLTVTETREIPFSIYSICYNEKRDQYVVGISGGQNFRFLDADFQPVDQAVTLATPLTKGYTTQGNACDDDLIYFVLYRKNVITVYDWDGHFVRLITLDEKEAEPENIDIINGEIYVSFVSFAGADIQKIHVEGAEK